MLFTEPIFLLFFAVVFALHWGLRAQRDRKILLLLSSYFFYAAWDWRFCGLILTSTVIDFGVGLALRGQDSDARRRSWLLVSVVANFTLLGFFKYFNFFVESANSIFGYFGVGEVRSLEVILPVGISFYTFQTLSYTVDVYRRRLAPISSFPDFALFVSFFPQLVMGPILRATDFLPQLASRGRLADVPFKALLTLFLIGFVKKTCVSDNIAPLVDVVYADPSAYTALSIWMAVLLYPVQLYCDFSGYTDMAIAVAGLLGYRVRRNFYFPLLASNITEFCRRWHMSFSSWLRDYLYIPLGGSRRGERRTLVNLMATLLLSGLWHGAGWTFITWGGLNGLGLCAHRLYESWDTRPVVVYRLFKALSHAFTIYWLSLTFIFFRAQAFGDAFVVCRAFTLGQSVGEKSIDPGYFLWFVPLFVAHWVAWRWDPTVAARKVPDAWFAIGLGLATAFALAFVRLEHRPFIYFQF